MAAYLIYKDSKYRLSPGINILGRQNDCAVQVKDPFISRRHLSIDLLQDGTLTLMDLGSSNGLVIQGKKVPNAILGPGESFTLGTSTFTIIQE